MRLQLYRLRFKLRFLICEWATALPSHLTACDSRARGHEVRGTELAADCLKQVSANAELTWLGRASNEGATDASNRAYEPKPTPSLGLSHHRWTCPGKLQIELVRNGWAIARHSSMEEWEVIARENKRGLWRGQFVLPELWRKGERLPGE